MITEILNANNDASLGGGLGKVRVQPPVRCVLSATHTCIRLQHNASMSSPATPTDRRSPDAMECDQAGSDEECILQDAKGTCIWFDRKKGYGFIEMERSEAVVNSLPIPTPNVFAHQSEVMVNGFRFLHPNRAVCCDIYKTADSRYRATRIRQGTYDVK